MPFIPKTPYLTTDGIIEIYKDDIFQGIVLIEHKNEPLGLALPGGFVDVGKRKILSFTEKEREIQAVYQGAKALIATWLDV